MAEAPTRPSALTPPPAKVSRTCKMIVAPPARWIDVSPEFAHLGEAEPELDGSDEEEEPSPFGRFSSKCTSSPSKERLYRP